MARRTFLECIGAASGAAVVGCAGMRRREVAQSVSERSELDPLTAEILADAAFAPSSHNTQPWRVVVESPDRVFLYADLERALPDVDPGRRELRLSLGAFVENFATSAGAHGFAVEVESAHDDDLAAPVAVLRLAPASSLRYPLAVLRRRCTVRRGLRSAPLSNEVVAGLVAARPGAIAYVDAREPLAALIREATLDAFRQQTERDSAERELARWIRFGSGAAHAHLDGLPIAGIGASSIATWYMRHFYDSADVMSRRFREGGIKLAAGQVREAGGWFIITSPDQHPASLLEAGRAFEQLALRACEHGIGIHPMSQALEEEPYRSQLLPRLGDGVPQFIVRAGLVDHYPDRITLRRPVRAFATRATP